ncbi:hypothetical protein pb186bvf_003344 [Paramecium bursaria]
MNNQNTEVRHSTRQRKVTELYKESYQEMKTTPPLAIKKQITKSSRFEQKRPQSPKRCIAFIRNKIALAQEFGYETEWLDCLFPSDDGTKKQLQIQFGVLKPKRSLPKRKVPKQEEGQFKHFLESLLSSVLTGTDNRRDHIQKVEVNTDTSMTLYLSFLDKEVQYELLKPEFELPDVTYSLSLANKFEQIKKKYKPLILL